MTVPAHPDLTALLRQAISTDDACAHRVAQFPRPPGEAFAAETIALWQHLGEHAPAASALADAWISGDTGTDPHGRRTVGITVSVAHPCLSVHLARTLDVDRIAGQIPPAARSGGLPTAAATLPALAEALDSLDTALAWAHDADPLSWAVAAHHHDQPGPAR